MKRPEVFKFSQERVRVLHFTWIAFFVTFYVWFSMAPLATTILDSIDGLTPDHIKVLAICNVALTIPARIAVGALIDKYGPRKVFSLLMITMAFPAFAFAVGNSFMQLLISRLVLGSIGAGFVIGIRMVAQWFPPKMIGLAEGFYAGWGNFGSAAAAMTLPWIGISLFGDTLGFGDEGWRWALGINAAVCLLYGVAYFFLVRDLPDGRKFMGTKGVDPMRVSSWGALVSYLLWSFPLVGAMGLLAWRLSTVDLNGSPLISPTLLWIIYGVLGVVYLVHVLKTLQVNVPRLRRGVPEADRYHFGSVEALNTTYFANFGAELAVVSMLPMFFEQTFANLRSADGSFLMTATFAGVVASSFAFVNLVARPLGGFLSDRMGNRKRTMLIYMAAIVLGFLGMASIASYGPPGPDGAATIVPMFDGVWWLIVAIVITVMCSIFVQGSEGATFAVIPMIHKPMTGQVAGMAGAYGNVGAVVYLVVYSLVDAKTFFYVIATGAAISFLFCLTRLKEPKNAFAEELQ